MFGKPGRRLEIPEFGSYKLRNARIKGLRGLQFPYIAATKYLRKATEKKKDLFWPLFPDAFLCGYQEPLFLDCNNVEISRLEGLPQKARVPHGNQQRSEERKDLGRRYSFQIYILSDVHTPHSPSTCGVIRALTPADMNPFMFEPPFCRVPNGEPSLPQCSRPTPKQLVSIS